MVLYYRKIEIEDDGEVEDVRKAVLVEIEDTPGSERGSDDAESHNDKSAGSGPPKIQKGSRVVLEKDKVKLEKLMKDMKNDKGKAYFKHYDGRGLDRMLGRAHIVKAVDDTTGHGLLFGLPSHDGSDGGVWYFPKDAVALKVALDMPIDKFMHLDIKDMQKYMNEKKMNAREQGKFKDDLQRPFSARERPVRHPDEDRSITRQRMGYFLCFDLSDKESESLKEAMKLYKMLQELDKDTMKTPPKIMLIGCKQDASSDALVVRRNTASAKKFASDNEIPFAATSARDHKGVREAFTDMVQAISSCEILWRMEENDGEDNDGNDEGRCFSQ